MKDQIKHGLALLATIVLLAIVAIGTLLLWYSWIDFIFVEHLRGTITCIAILLAYYLVSLMVHTDDD